jgi:hypothetical protein
MYSLSGSLDGVVPGRRVVKDLHVKRLDGGGTEGLAPLLAFGDLRSLTLEQVRDVDLDPLRELDIEFLRLNQAAGVDLAALAELPRLAYLYLADLDDDCTVPGELTLASTLSAVGLYELRRSGSGRIVKALLEAIDWSRMGSLVGLYARVGGMDRLPPVETDLSFLRCLGELENLDLLGVHHSGPSSSPLEPPFDGLSRKLRRVMIEAWDPLRIRQALDDYLDAEVGPQGGLASVGQRQAYVPPRPPWTILGRADAHGAWHVYGSLADAASMTSDQTETEALRDVRRRLREADPKLLRRLDFDPESSGTGISARSREDLEAALQILGLQGPEQRR